MSDKRIEIRDALIDAIEVLALVPAGNVLRWTGSEETFNPSKKFPSIGVGYPPAREPRAIFRDLGENTGKSRETTLRFGVYVSATGDGPTAEDQADAILGALEAGLHGAMLNTAHYGNVRVLLGEGNDDAEVLLAASASVRIISQIYRVKVVEDSD